MQNILTEQEANKIFSWQPYRDDWTVDRNKIEDNIESYYGNLIKDFMNNSSFDTFFSEDGGLGNYLEFICNPAGHVEYEGNGILVCISLCSPYCTYGQITIYKDQKSFGRSNIFNPENAYQISDPHLFQIENSIIDIFKSHNISLLDTEFLSKQLPLEIAQNLKFENHNKGSQYLHGIFQKTD